MILHSLHLVMMMTLCLGAFWKNGGNYPTLLSNRAKMNSRGYMGELWHWKRLDYYRMLSHLLIESPGAGFCGTLLSYRTEQSLKSLIPLHRGTSSIFCVHRLKRIEETSFSE